MTQRVMDDFSAAAAWKSFASGRAQLQVTSESCDAGHALRLDFDFQGGKGFVGIRKDVVEKLPEAYSFTFRIRGKSPENKLEFKLTDAANLNVWRWQQEGFVFEPKGTQVTIRSTQMEFAWGPAGSGTLRHLGGIEFAITAEAGGRGTVWIEDFQFVNRTVRKKPLVTSSSAMRGYEAANVLAGTEEKSWRPSRTDALPWLQFDFHQQREYGGLIIDWGPRPDSRAFTIQTSDDGLDWATCYQATRSQGSRSLVPLPNGESRFLRLEFEGGVDVRHVAMQPFDFSRSQDDFIHEVARRDVRGRYPRYTLREQSYWTCAGVLDGKTCALINEEGLIEPDKGSFSLEPSLFISEKLMTWADARRTVRLEENSLPIPTVQWTLPECRLEITPFATDGQIGATLFARYRFTNTTSRALRTKLFIAIRPHQVSPPWQKWQGIGGVSAIKEIEWKSGAAWVNRQKLVVPLSAASDFGAAAFEQGSISDYLGAGKLPTDQTIHDASGLASAAFCYDLKLPSGAAQDIFIAVPFGLNSKFSQQTVRGLSRLDGELLFNEAVSTMQASLGSVTFQLPAGWPQAAARTFHTAAGQILINRDGPALQPGPRRYTRSWIRDAASMGAALLRSGNRTALPEHVRWYAQFQREDGFVPCCVDRTGPDWLVEHDSHGQFIYAVRESFRFNRDRNFLKEMWPAILKAAEFIRTLRATRLSAEYQQPGKTEFYGLLPESASHEGYLAQPVHSYWDDFWALRGLRDVSAIAQELGHQQEFQRFSTVALDLSDSLQSSIRKVIADKELQYIPGSVEWADYDPTATANALMLFPETAGLPDEQLHSMFDQFVNDTLRRHRGEIPWNNYSAYEIRIIGALIRLGKREAALELLEFYLSDRRPLRWNQWPEISWHNVRAPAHLGDIPHTWIAGEFMLAFAALFAYEREHDDSLVIGAGVDEKWISHRSGMTVTGLPTWYGVLDLKMSRSSSNTINISLGGHLRIPDGGFVLKPPLLGPVSAVTVNGEASHDFTEQEICIRQFPAEVTIETMKPSRNRKQK